MYEWSEKKSSIDFWDKLGKIERDYSDSETYSEDELTEVESDDTGTYSEHRLEEDEG